MAAEKTALASAQTRWQKCCWREIVFARVLRHVALFATVPTASAVAPSSTDCQITTGTPAGTTTSQAAKKGLRHKKERESPRAAASHRVARRCHPGPGRCSRPHDLAPTLPPSATCPVGLTGCPAAPPQDIRQRAASHLRWNGTQRCRPSCIWPVYSVHACASACAHACACACACTCVPVPVPVSLPVSLCCLCHLAA